MNHLVVSRKVILTIELRRWVIFKDTKSKKKKSVIIILVVIGYLLTTVMDLGSASVLFEKESVTVIID